VGIGTIIRVEARIHQRTVPRCGIVVEGFSYADLLTPLPVLSHDGSPSGASPP
jgi:hypothetical protein